MVDRRLQERCRSAGEARALPEATAVVRRGSGADYGTAGARLGAGRMMELLHLLQLADSALPVGGMAHSFGLESLVELGFVGPDGLEQFLRDWLAESGALEAAFCARACSA